MFTIDTNPISKAIKAVANARKETEIFDSHRRYLFETMNETMVGRIGAEKRKRELEALRDEWLLKVESYKGEVEAARTAFIALVDEASMADGAKLDAGDIAVLNANAVLDSDLVRMLKKHEHNYTMTKAIVAYCVRNNIAQVGGEDLLVPSVVEENALREFATVFFDKCAHGVSFVHGYDALFVLDRNAVAGIISGLSLENTINVDRIEFPQLMNYTYGPNGEVVEEPVPMAGGQHMNR